MFTQNTNLVPVQTNPTFADLQLNAVFHRVTVKGWKTGTKPQTIYRKVQDGKGGCIAIISGATNGQALHNGDALGEASAYVQDTTRVCLLGQDNSTFDCKC